MLSAKIIFGERQNNLLLTLEVGTFGSTFTANGLFLCLEESITSRLESFPNLLRILTRSRTNGLPFILQRDKLISGFTPIGAGAECFGTLTEFDLTLKIVGLLTTHRLEELGLLVEEVVTRLTEALEKLGIDTLGSEAQFTPLVLETSWKARITLVASSHPFTVVI